MRRRRGICCRHSAGPAVGKWRRIAAPYGQHTGASLFQRSNFWRRRRYRDPQWRGPRCTQLSLSAWHERATPGTQSPACRGLTQSTVAWRRPELGLGARGRWRASTCGAGETIDGCRPTRPTCAAVADACQAGARCASIEVVLDAGADMPSSVTFSQMFADEHGRDADLAFVGSRHRPPGTTCFSAESPASAKRAARGEDRDDGAA